MSGVVIGIDPGLTGAVGVVNNHGEFVAVWDLPIIRDASLAWVDAVEFRSRYLALMSVLSPSATVRFVVERVGAMPKQGVAGVFTFGATFGSILSAVQATRQPMQFVTPAVWKRAMSLSGKAGAVTSAKRAALHKARLLFPTAELDLCKHEGRAEALLLAYYSQQRAAVQQLAVA